MRLVEQHVWVKGCESNACVEVMQQGQVVRIGSTGGALAVSVTKEEWETFKAAVKAGRFD